MIMPRYMISPFIPVIAIVRSSRLQGLRRKLECVLNDLFHFLGHEK